MQKAIKKIRPATGFSGFLHVVLTVMLPLLAYVFVRINLVQLAIAIVLLSKWRVLAVRPRHWPVYLRANSVDIIAGISFVIFMSQTGSIAWQLVWALGYTVWLLFLKPSTSTIGISFQAFMAQTLGLMALFMGWGGESLSVLLIGAWAVCYFCARHFFSTFEDPLGRFLSGAWAFFSSSLVWVLAHWLLYYGLVAQPTLLLTVLGFGLGSMYFLKNTDKLSRMMKHQIIFAMTAVVTVVILFSDWADKAI